MSKIKKERICFICIIYLLSIYLDADLLLKVSLRLFMFISFNLGYTDSQKCK